MTEVKIVLASVATALAGYQHEKLGPTSAAELESRRERLEERIDAREKRIEEREED